MCVYNLTFMSFTWFVDLFCLLLWQFNVEEWSKGKEIVMWQCLKFTHFTRRSRENHPGISERRLPSASLLLHYIPFDCVMRAPIKAVCQILSRKRNSILANLPGAYKENVNYDAGCLFLMCWWNSAIMDHNFAPIVGSTLGLWWRKKQRTNKEIHADGVSTDLDLQRIVYLKRISPKLRKWSSIGSGSMATKTLINPRL